MDVNSAIQRAAQMSNNNNNNSHNIVNDDFPNAPPRQQHHPHHAGSSSVTHSLSLSDPSESRSYFASLFNNPSFLTRRGALELLVSTAAYFARGDATPDQCALYLRAAAHHADSLLLGDQRYVGEIIQAAGCAATRCCHRSAVSESGIIPVLARLAIPAEEASSLTLDPDLDEPHDRPPGDESSAAAATVTLSSLASVNVRHVLTAAHTELLQACITAGHYAYACRVTDQYPVYATKSGMSREQFLRYFYLLGVVRLNMGRYREAVHALEVCVTTPCQVISAITVAAFKKLLLLHCFLLVEDEDCHFETNGDAQTGPETVISASTESPYMTAFTAAHSAPSGKKRNQRQADRKSSMAQSVYKLPKTTPTVVHKFLDGAAEPMPLDLASSNAPPGDAISTDNTSTTVNTKTYHYSGVSYYYTLVEHFYQDDDLRYDQHTNDMADLLQQDGNYGIARQVGNELTTSKKILLLSRLYDAIPLPKLAKKLGLESSEEAERHVMRCQRGQIDEEEGVVYFDNNDDDHHQQQAITKGLTTRITDCIELAERIKKMDIALSTSPKYCLTLQRNSSGGDTSSGVGVGGPRGVIDL